MELCNQIRKYRAELGISQEELSERVYVSRQTISNWENEKSYPDIHSLILLSQVFKLSLDQLIKGDIEKMREEIKESDIKQFNQYGMIFTLCFVVMIVSPIPLTKYLGLIGGMLWVVIGVVTMAVGIKVEGLKKSNNIQTYREILLFTEGKRLDELNAIKENAKRPYQKVLLALGSAALTAFIAFVLFLILY